MSDESHIGGIQSSSPRSPSDSLKSGPTPREVEVLERRHRDRVHSERGKPGQAHRIERDQAVSDGKSSGGSTPQGSAGLDVTV